MFRFLEELRDNNHKEWLDRHRKRYLDLKAEYQEWVDRLDVRLQQLDPDYYPTPGKRALTRINNNLMFHPNKPTYKDYIGAALDRRPGTGDFYIHLGAGECFIAGGFFRPEAKVLRSIREGIDYNGEELQALIEVPSFVKYFGPLDTTDNLKTAPKGYPKDHPHIELLRRKSFEAYHAMERSMVFEPHYLDYVTEVYNAMLPFRKYLNKTVTV